MGSLSVITGPMYSSKTMMLIQQGTKYIAQGKKVIAFKPTIDNRFSEDEIVSRAGTSIKAVNIDGIHEIPSKSAGYDVILIDEFQFFMDWPMTYILRDLADAGKTIIVSGLNLDSDRVPFSSMMQLFSYADNIRVMKAVCHKCRKDKAIYTQANFVKDTEIVVGNNYSAVCAECY